MEILLWIFILFILIGVFFSVVMGGAILTGLFLGAKDIVKEIISEKQNDPNGKRKSQTRDRYRKSLYGKRYFDDSHDGGDAG